MAAVEKCERHVADATAKGAKVRRAHEHMAATFYRSRMQHPCDDLSPSRAAGCNDDSLGTPLTGDYGWGAA